MFYKRPFLLIRFFLRTPSWAISIFLFSSACGAPQDIQPAMSNLTGLTTEHLWKKNDLTVCFADKQSANNAKKYEEIISKAVQKAYAADVTGISLSGFEKCSESSDADVTFVLADNFQGGLASQIGQFKPNDGSAKEFSGIKGAAVKLSPAYVLKQHQPNAAKVSTDEAVAEVALHELGHIVGLFHEHGHPQSTCSANSRENAQEAREMLGDDNYLDKGTAYDPYSIMSYCKTFMLVGDSQLYDSKIDPQKLKPGLSENDKKFLKQLYPRKDKSADSKKSKKPSNEDSEESDSSDDEESDTKNDKKTDDSEDKNSSSSKSSDKNSNTKKESNSKQGN